MTYEIKCLFLSGNATYSLLKKKPCGITEGINHRWVKRIHIPETKCSVAFLLLL